jgi:hypothetical protein
MVVEHRQRMAAPAAAQGHVALEVHLPEFVGAWPFEAHISLMLDAGPCLDAASLVQEPGNRTGDRQSLQAQILEATVQLARTPSRVRCT